MKYIFITFLVLLSGNLNASKLLDIQLVDNKCLVLHVQDGYVNYFWDDTISGSCNGWNYYYTENWHLCNNKDEYIPYGEPLNTAIIGDNSKEYFSLSCGKRQLNISEIYRKSKVWEASHTDNTPVMHHWIYLDLKDALEKDSVYVLKMSPSLNISDESYTFIYDERQIESPSIKISNIGYTSNSVYKSADIYLWMGDGGKRDFSRLNGTDFYLLDVNRNKIVYSGKMKLHSPQKKEPRYNVDFVGSDVWECDFSSYKNEGVYKLIINGIGCSRPFNIEKNVYEEAFKVSMQGMFYQRMGCEQKPVGDNPFSRRPLFKQGIEPDDFKVYVSKRNMVTGRNPDDMAWYAEENTGELLKESWGGWSDAYDNDQRPDNFICVFDLLLTYYLYPEAFKDNQLYVPEANNNIPDILDEALWEIDWWLRLRNKKGDYLTGLCNIIPPASTNYAGAPCAWHGWCVSAACAMVADCFRINGNEKLKEKYTKAAEEAWTWSMKQPDQMRNVVVYELRGSDLKMTAAAFLYNLTGDKKYESVINEESVAKNTTSRVREISKVGQQYATVAYLLSPQKRRYEALYNNMLESIIYQAKTDYVDNFYKSPSKSIRYTATADGLCITSSEVSLVAIAHKISKNKNDKEYFEKGLCAEAEWTLGRNPLGLVQMTGLSDNCITQTFAPGRRDGYPGVTPGWTPYMMRDGWMRGDNIHGCDWYLKRIYPSDKLLWPMGEHFWNSRYCVPNSENTPQQAFRQKILLYGYLYAINS